MKKRILSILTVLALCLGLLPVTALAIDQAPSGSGTEESPYQIGTADELRWLAEYVNGSEYNPAETFLYVELTADIDLNPSYTFAADGTFTGGESPVEWAPIGLITTDLNTQKPFYGSFDGKGHTIRGLYTAAGDSDSLGWGLFSYAVGYITDLHLENSYIGSVSACTGSIAGILGGTIENCSSAAYLSCGENWGALNGHGGIVGNLNDVRSEALSCTFSGVLHQTGGSPYVGGVVGSNLYGYVADCVNRGRVTADNADEVGGIVGNNSIAEGNQNPIAGQTSVIERCVNYGAVTSTYSSGDYVGGIVGMSSWGDGTYAGAVRDCLNLGTVTGVTYVGGIAGYLEEDTPLENCYNAGSVTGGTNAAGLVGKQSKGCPITNSYYLKTDTLNSGLQAVGALGTGNYVPEEEEQVNYTACVTAEAAASGQLAWTLQKGRETLVWGQALTGQTPDETPGLTAEQEKRVMQVKFLSADDTTASELATRYTNAGTVLADYPSPSGGDERYIFYTDSGCTQAIAPDTHTFAADATLYVKTTTPTQVTITGVNAQGGTYNGQAQTGYTGTPSAQGFTGEFVVTYNTADGKAPTDAGTYTVTIAIPKDDAQYVGSIVLEFAIAKKPLTVSAPSPSVYVGDNAPELALTYTGLVDGESVTPSKDPVFTITKADGTVIALADAVQTAGTYTITWSNADSTTFPDGANYAIQTETTGTLTVSTRSSGGTTTYPIQVEENSQNGGVQVSPKNAVPGTLVTVTPQPAPGYELATLSVLDQYGNEVDVNPLGNGNYSFKMPRSRVKVEATFYCTGSELCPTHHLADVLVKAWYHDAVDYVVEHGIMTGTSATTFEPNTTLSRAMVAQILYNLEGQPTVTGESTFTDASGHWAVNAIAWAQQTGVVNGYEDNTFRPNRAASREELAQMLYNYAKVKGYDLTASGDLTAFPDGSKVSSWAEAAMAWANGNELINGHDDGTLQPGGDSTRAQAASILMSFDLNLAN